MEMKCSGQFLLAWAAFVLALSLSPAAFAQSPQQAQPAPAVVVDEVEVGSSAASYGFKGQVEAIEAVDIPARASGVLKEVLFNEGQAVKTGDMLFEIDPDQLQVALSSAEAQLARAVAARGSAEQTVTRTRALRQSNTTSQAALDDAEAALDIASADVQNAEAGVENARLNLSYTKVHTPIDGMIGRALFTKGNLVGPGLGPLARVVQLDPIRIVFSVPDRVMVSLRQNLAQGKTIDRDTFQLTLLLANGTEYDQEGEIDFMDNAVSTLTGTVAIRAQFPNPDHILMPGQFVTLNLRDVTAPDLALVPMSAVSRDREGEYVYILNADNTIARQVVETGARIGNKWSVTKGLEGGETVVVEGLQRATDGLLVEPHQSGTAQ